MAHPRIFALPAPVIGAAYLVGYVALDWISFIDPFAPFGITPWNPPPGLSFVLILLFGQRFLPLLFVAHLLADLLVRHLPFAWSMELLGVAVIGGGDALGLCFLLRPATRFNPAMASMRDLVTLLAVAGLTAALVAVSYVGLLVVFGLLTLRDFAPAALQFWVGDVIGIAVVAPGALIFLARGRFLAITRETAAQILAILVALALVFVYAQTGHFQLFYVLFLPIIWMAVRGGLEAVTIGILLTQIGLVLGVQMAPAGEIDVTAFQALMLVLALTGLVAGALVNEHRGTEISSACIRTRSRAWRGWAVWANSQPRSRMKSTSRSPRLVPMRAWSRRPCAAVCATIPISRRRRPRRPPRSSARPKSCGPCARSSASIKPAVRRFRLRIW